MKYKDCIIIGAGVSGMTSAIYLKRFNLDIMIIESEYPGGQINKTDIIENYPGFIKINGYELSDKIYKQVKNLEIEYKNEKVIEIKKGNIIEIITNKNKYYAKNVIIASGRSPKKLNIENEDKFNNKGISYCAICDGALYKNKVVAVIGSGDSAVTAANFLSNICSKVYLIVRKDKLKAQKYLIEKINNKIEILYNREVKKINGIDKLESITLNSNEEINIEGLFIYIGSIPNTDFIDVEKDNGYIVVDNYMKTSENNIYASGDVIKKEVYQITTSISDATIAAINCTKEIN